MSCEMRSMITSYFFGSSIRMPPIFTNSALTPAIFIELIFSTSAGGNVLSLPKRIAIFFATAVSCLDALLTKSHPERSRRIPMPFAPPPPQGILPHCYHRRERRTTSDRRLKVLPRHPLPQRPIMLAVVPVNIQPMRNPLAVQNRRHLHVRVQTHIPIRRSQHNPHLPVTAQEPLIARVRQVVWRIVEVNIVV